VTESSRPSAEADSPSGGDRLDVATLRGMIIEVLVDLDRAQRAAIVEAMAAPDAQRVPALRRAIEQSVTHQPPERPDG
jgi:hypothetical protein